MATDAAIPAVSVLPTVAVHGRTRHILFLDHIRGVAILAVFVFHCVGAVYPYDRFPWDGWHRRLPATALEWLIAPMRFGWAGVPIFFAVSGFCIHLSFTHRPDWKDFCARRFFRIYPPYLLALLFFAFVLPLSRLDFHDRSAFVQLGTHLALIHNFGNTTLGGINGAFWSIAVEVQLYALYPLLILLVRRLGWGPALGLAAALEVACRLAILFYPGRTGGDPFAHVPMSLVGFPLGFWFSWSVGAYVAESYRRGTVGTLSRFLPPFGLLALAVGAEMFRASAVFSFTLFSLATAAVIARLLADEKPRRRLLPRFLSHRLAETGLWSYSIYLLHSPLLASVTTALKAYLPPAWNTLPILLCGGLSTFLFIKPLSGAWYYFCELKGIALGKRVMASLGLA